jgi:hypothetical protein
MQHLHHPLIRSISPSELEKFAAAGVHTLGTDEFAQYIRELWERGASTPDRCFVAEADGQFVGRIVYRGQGEEVNFTGLYLPWDGDYLSIGQQRFRESLARLQQEGVHILEAYVTTAWGYHDRARRLMEQLGLTLVQTKLRYTWKQNEQQEKRLTPSSRLVFRTLPEIGEDAFADLIRRATAGTLDRLDQLQIEEMGQNSTPISLWDCTPSQYLSSDRNSPALALTHQGQYHGSGLRELSPARWRGNQQACARSPS